MSQPTAPIEKPGVTHNAVRRALDSGRTTLCTHISLLAPEVMEAIGRTGVYDYVEVVVEYGTYDTPTLENLCRTAELYGMGTMIKINGYDTMLGAQRAVGAGFDAVLFSEPRSAGDVAKAVSSVRPEHPADGGLSGLGARRFLLPGYVSVAEYVERLRSIVVVAMIEKPAAADAIDEIVEIAGLDMILWGPLDYSLTLGRPGDTECREVREVGERVIAAAHAAGTRVRAEIESVEEAKYFLDLGVKDFGFAGDLRTLYRSLKSDGAELRDLFAASE